ncbi:MAG: hypothetical protein Q4B86_07090 [Eubacteriales bacterium]|nr:hypothetical protein [Eubacteriales bacterium]
MEQFLQVFGGITVSQIAIVTVAIIFLLKISSAVKKYLKDKTEEELKQREKITNIINLSEKYPEWRQQSISVQKEIMKQMEKMDSKIDALAVSNSEGMAYTWRYRILRFDDELRHNKKHTKEHFDQILEDITKYEKFCKDHPEFPNNKAIFAIANIKEIYQECTREGSFL